MVIHRDDFVPGRPCLKCGQPILEQENSLYINKHRKCLLKTLNRELHFDSLTVVTIECSNCKEIKDIGEFYTSNSHSTNKQYLCKPCNISKCKTEFNMKAAEASNKQYHSHFYRKSEQSKKRDILVRVNNPSLFTKERLAIKITNSFTMLRKGKSINTCTDSLVGCSIVEYAKYIESLWQPGMSWDNWGHHKFKGQKVWNIKRIKPASMFDFSDPTEGWRKRGHLRTYTKDQLLYFHYTNSRPEWVVPKYMKNKQEE